MFERLKSLPLTIVLTILIWMYAESQVHSSHAEARLDVSDIPVWITWQGSNDPGYAVTVYPPTVSITISGSPEQIDALRRENPIPGIHAYLDLAASDSPSGLTSTRSLRLELPPGISLASAPPPVQVTMIAKRATAALPAQTAPSPGPHAATQEAATATASGS